MAEQLESFHGQASIAHKIIDKIRHINEEEKRPFYSFEFFPPKTDAGVANLYARIERMGSLEPAFVDVTWGAGGSTSDLTTELCVNAQNYENVDVMMHLTCTNMPIEKLRETLNEVKRLGIRNIMALRGDAPREAANWTACQGGFSYASDLVKFIRAEHGDYFCIGVAGYPEGHTESTDLEVDLAMLKLKVDAGADMIITQLFYDVDRFLEFVARARAIGIKIPIIPGIMPIQSYAGFMRMVGFCRTHVPQAIMDALTPIQNDDNQVKSYGIKLGIEMGRRLLENGMEGLHFYTLNLERSTIKIMEGLGMVAKKNPKKLPWKASQVARRAAEEVRPIFWANRPSSYLQRTQSWDEFPNGRWGDARSPAFGDLSDYHLCPLQISKPQVRRAMWGETLQSVDDVAGVFAKYIRGEIPKLPWCEGQIHLETLPMAAQLLQLNAMHFFTINSQPRINGAASTDPVVGWGGAGGYIYQKAYLEFFTSATNVERLVQTAKQFPGVTFHAVHVQGQSITNTSLGINAVTWGVFPGSEVKQPTVVCAYSFQIWKDEAFALWKSQWGSAYDVNSASYSVIESIREGFWLVNVVDNDYVNGDIYKFLEKVGQCTPESIEESSRIAPQIAACECARLAALSLAPAVDVYDLGDD